MLKLKKTIATLFFAGFFPVAPGTLASLIGAGAYLAVRGNMPLYIIFTVLSLALGFWSAAGAERAFHKKDPPQIVIDEFSSMLLVYLFVPFSAKFLITGFVLFRVLDIFKIPPIKRLQRLPAGWGIMLDDIAAAILVNIILQVLRFLPLPQ